MKKKLIIFGASLLTAYCVVGLARADEGFIAWLGRVEAASCHYLESDPVITVCVSESFVCTFQNEEQTCRIKR